jgi:hypothetical protein
MNGRGLESMRIILVVILRDNSKLQAVIFNGSDLAGSLILYLRGSTYHLLALGCRVRLQPDPRGRVASLPVPLSHQSPCSLYSLWNLFC